MKYYRYFFILIFFANNSIALFGQITLSEADKQAFEVQAKRKIKSFEYNIKQILNDVTNRSTWIEESARLFKPNATIEVAGKKSGITKHLIANYLNIVIPKYSQKYSVVVIDFIAIRIGDFKEMKHANGKIYYEAEIEFKQRFCRSEDKSKGGELSEFDYCDTTDKKGTIVLEQKTNRKGNYWQLLLGDIKVLSIND
jgi:hypothetical protein